MKIHTSLDKTICAMPVVMTIGFFDGVHRGHAALIQRVHEVAAKHSLESLVVTFNNHPATVLHKGSPTTLLCGTSERIRRLGELPIDHLLVIDFDQALAHLSAEDFLKKIDRIAPLSHLVLGHDAVLGYKRQGDRHYMEHLAADWGFTLEYMSPVLYNGQIISSSAIRKALEAGDADLANAMLGLS